MLNIIEALDNLPDPETLWQQSYRKQLGQNFIFDKNLNAKIAGFVPLQEAEAVLEIGAGVGTLTRAILYEMQNKNSKAKLFIIEADERCLPSLQLMQDIMGDSMHIERGFAEKQDLAKMLPRGTAVIGNLPYNVASMILLKLLDNIDLFSSLTLMFQAEVAQRICANPNSKDYGRLSVATQFLCSARTVMTLPPHCFTPRPKVDSAIVQLLPLKEKKRQASMGALQEILRLAFGVRRKMLRNALQVIDNSSDLLARAGIDGMRRAETLTIEEFDRLAVCYEER